MKFKEFCKENYYDWEQEVKRLFWTLQELYEETVNYKSWPSQRIRVQGSPLVQQKGCMGPLVCLLTVSH